MFEKYIQGSVQAPLIDTIYGGLKEHVDATHGLMSALGSFWFESFGNLSRDQSAYETIMHAMTGCVLPFSDAYRGLLDATLEASIQTVPEVRDKQLELVVFTEPKVVSVEGHGTGTSKSKAVSAALIDAITKAGEKVGLRGAKLEGSVAAYILVCELSQDRDYFILDYNKGIDDSYVRIKAYVDTDILKKAIQIARDQGTKSKLSIDITAERIGSPDDYACGSAEWCFYGTPILDVDYFMANLYGSPIVLEKGTHFDVDEETGDITFYVDIFGDPAIIQDAYGEFDTIEHPQRSIMLWGVNVVQQSFRIWERYGQLVYRKAADSMDYKALIDALMYYYVNMKDIQNVENVMNIVAGIPYSRHDGEVVKRIYEVGADLTTASAVLEGDDYFVCIETEYNGVTYRYYSYGLANITVKVGDVLSKYQLLGRLNEVYDYLQIERDPAKFIPASANPDGMSRDEQIDYVYTHWNDRDNSQASDDEIELVPELRADIIRYVLKYNSLFIKQVVSLQSYDTYLYQIEEMRKVLRSGLPVYLNPILETIFRMKLVDNVPTDEELKERIANAANAKEREQWEQWANTYAVIIDGDTLTDITAAFEDVHKQDVIYNGELGYNGGTCRDHNSEMTSIKLRYNALAKYNADWAHHGSSTHGKNLYYNGHVSYGNCMLNMHDYESDVFMFTKFNLNNFNDEFQYSLATKALKKQIYYDSEYIHDGSAKYGLTDYVPVEVSIKANSAFIDDTFGGITDPFEISIKSASSQMLDMEDFASYSDTFAMRLGVADEMADIDDMLTIHMTYRWSDDLPAQEDDLVLTPDIAG